ncbi:ATPase [Apiospora phragmitis]|uniref:ATPase n=1 Tax=Apiospora phragmitis TaxID=2905665 RepID=A0ABR1VTH6_9PEZI
MKKAFSATEQRDSVLVIVTDQSDEGEFHISFGRYLHVPTYPTPDSDFEALSRFVTNPARDSIEITPLETDAQFALLGKDDEHHALKAVKSHNIHALKYEVASRRGRDIPSLVQPYTHWQLPEDSHSWQILTKFPLSAYQVESIANLVLQSLGIESLDIESIDYAISNIMDYLYHQDQNLHPWKSAEKDDVLSKEKTNNDKGLDSKETSDSNNDDIQSDKESGARETSDRFPLRFPFPFGEDASEASDEEENTSDGEKISEGSNDVELRWSEKVRDVIQEIEQHEQHEQHGCCKFEYEAKLLGSLVNPAQVHDIWDAVALEPDVRNNILRMMTFNIEKPVAYGILKKAQVRGALLYGPPGTGKTHLARVLAKESKSTMIQVSAAEVEDKYVGETEKNIKALFNLGRMVSPSIIFIDEADSLFRTRTGNNWGYDIRRIYLGPPSLEVREELLRIYLREERIESSGILPDLASMTAEYSGSDHRTLCIHAATSSQSELESLGEGVLGKRRVIKMVHFREALQANSPNITRGAMKEIERFAAEFDRQSLESIRAYFYPKEPISAIKSSNPPISSPVLTSNPKQVANTKRRSELSNDRNTNVTEVPVIASMVNDTANIKLGPCTPTSPFQPLDSTLPEIRVLELVEPATPTRKPHCRLRTVTLQPGLEFTALSYMWGDPALNEEIILNEEPLRITKSLANALRWVKHHWQQYFPGQDRSEFCIWADAVCINQEDNTEKSFQVPLMGKIYGTAELVISLIATQDIAIKFALRTYHNLWKVLASDSTAPMSLDELTDQEWMKRVPYLTPRGDDDTQEEEAEGTISPERCPHCSLSTSLHYAPNMTEAEFARYCNARGENPTCISAQLMGLLPYWRRVWMFQEIVLGKNLLLICDDASLDFKVAEDFTQTLQLARAASYWSESENHPHWKQPEGWCAECWDFTNAFSSPSSSLGDNCSGPTREIQISMRSQ